MNNKIKLGILGGGSDSLIGIVHRIASNMFDRYELVGGVFNPSIEISKKFAIEVGISTDRVYETVAELIECEKKRPIKDRIEVVSILTPNHLHFSMAKQLIENNFHVICEKPVTTTYKEAKTLQDSLQKKNTIFAVTYTYTGYPMVRQMKQMIREDVLGTIQKVDIQYYQGWINPMIHDKKKRNSVWRLNPKIAGISCCLGDIGTHAFQMVEYLTSINVQSILADLNRVYPDNVMDVDGSVLLRLSNGAKGMIRTSQIATGEENNFMVNIYGRKGSLTWRQENPNKVYWREEGKAMRILTPGHDYNSTLSMDASKMPPGHPEGIFDAMGNIYHGVAKAIRGESYDTAEFPTLYEGARGMYFVEKAIQSDKENNTWVELN